MSEADNSQLPPPDNEATAIDSQAEAGAWLDVKAATAFLAIAERTLYRRVDRGELQKRSLPGGRVEFWIAGASPDMATAELATRHDVAVDRADLALALYDQIEERVERRAAPLRETIREQAEEIERLKAELVAATRQLPPPDTRDTRPWWRRLLG